MLRLFTILATLAAVSGCAGLETCKPVDPDEIRSYQRPTRTDALKLPADVRAPDYKTDYTIPGEDNTVAGHEPSRTTHCLQIPPRVVPIPTDEDVEEAVEEAKEEKAEQA